MSESEVEKQLDFMLTEPEYTEVAIGKSVQICKPRDTDKAGHGCIKVGGDLMISVEWFDETPATKGSDEVTEVEEWLGGKVMLHSGRAFKNPLKRWTFYPIKFVRYDENVYNELVHTGTANACVETDIAKLGPL